MATGRTGEGGCNFFMGFWYEKKLVIYLYNKLGSKKSVFQTWYSYCGVWFSFVFSSKFGCRLTDIAECLNKFKFEDKKKALKPKVSDGCCLTYPRDKNNQINLTLLYSIEVFIYFAFLSGQWVAWHFSLTGTAYTDKLWILTVTLQQKSLYSLDYVNSSTGKLENSLYLSDRKIVFKNTLLNLRVCIKVESYVQ